MKIFGRRQRRDAGGAALEFALVLGAFLIVCLGVMDVGLLLWTQQALDMAAAKTARCAALGCCVEPPGTACVGSSQYAVDMVTFATFASVVGTSNVWVQGSATCTSTSGNVTAGKYTVVRISTSYWANGLLPKPFLGKVLSAAACYPSSA
jgi:hypothetical protein